MHESVANEVLALVAMKKPSSHTEHVGSSVVVPITDVYVPARQLVCAMHTSLVSMSESDSAPFVLNVPLAQSTHSVSVPKLPLPFLGPITVGPRQRNNSHIHA